jgi:hypothetical protein
MGLKDLAEDVLPDEGVRLLQLQDQAFSACRPGADPERDHRLVHNLVEHLAVDEMENIAATG